MPSKKKAEPARALADALRSSKGVDYTTAKLEADEGEATWVDFCRAKDLLKHLAAHPQLTAELARPGSSPEEAALQAAQHLVSSRLLLPCARRFKKPKPGRKKLVKWPRTLELGPRGVPLDGEVEVFLAWSYDRPTTAWFYVGSAALALAALGVTLFPLAPAPVRLVVLYVLLTVLCALLGLIGVRYPIWAAVWVTSGCDFWVLPNLMSDQLPITEIFSPVVSFSRPDKGWRHALVGRLALLLAISGACYVLTVSGPDTRQLSDSVKDAHDSLLNYFDLMGLNRDSITGNTTAAANHTSGAAKEGSSQNSSSSSQSSGMPADPTASSSSQGAGGAGSTEGAAAAAGARKGQKGGSSIKQPAAADVSQEL